MIFRNVDRYDCYLYLIFSPHVQPFIQVFKSDIHPSIIFITYPLEGRWGSWSHSQLILGKRQGPPRTGRQCITEPTYTDKQPFTLKFTTVDNSESLTKLIPLFVFGLWEEAQADTGITCKLHKERLRLNRSAVLATTPPFL